MEYFALPGEVSKARFAQGFGAAENGKGGGGGSKSSSRPGFASRAFRGDAFPMLSRAVLLYSVLLSPCVSSYRPHPKGGAECKTDWDCTLGGGCEGGVCICDAAFTGANCTYFDMLPTPGAAYNQSNSSSWGGRANYCPEDSLWHMHVSEMGYGCGLDDWEPGSTIVHATSATLWGPYTRSSVVAPAFSHNAEAWRMPDGSWVLGQVGSGDLDPKYNGTVKDCRSTGNGTTPRNPPMIPPQTLPGWVPWGVHRSTTGPGGPFLPFNFSGGWHNSPQIGGWSIKQTWNGSWVSTAGGGGMGTLSTAADWRGNWTTHPKRVLPASLKPNFTADEDPDIFVTARGYYHLVVHNWGWPCQESGNYSWWSDGNTNTGGCGAHWYSANGEDWMWSPTVLYNSTIVFTDGSVRDFGRERPKVIMDPTHTFPIALMNGVAEHCCGNVGPELDDKTSTMIVPLVTPKPVPPMGA
jgi:hypothetical protein